MGLFYRLLRGILRWGLRAFFRVIEVRGGDQLPRDGPCIVAANHPNSLVDPVLLIVALDRPLCFIAKAPLFRMPVLGSVLRRLRCIPAHRSQDAGYAKEKNEGLYAAAAEVLAAGPALAVFPEGKSHSEPRLAELRHGAAKIALETELLRGGVRIQLVGLHFEDSRGFRGRVLVQLGPPVAAADFRARYEADPREGIAALTAELQARLSGMVLVADDHEALRLTDLLASMRATQEVGRPHEPAEAFDRKKLILARYRVLRDLAPREVEALRDGLERYEEFLERVGAREEHVAAAPLLVSALLNSLALAASLPVLAVGLALNFPPYLLCWLVARLAGRLPDRRASAGFLSALAAFPLFWGLLGWLAARRWGLPAGLAAAALGPLSGAPALLIMDRWHRAFVQTAGLWLALVRPAARARLRRLRARLLERADRLLAKLPVPAEGS